MKFDCVPISYIVGNLILHTFYENSWTVDLEICKPLEFCNIDLKSRSQSNFLKRFDFTRKTRFMFIVCLSSADWRTKFKFSAIWQTVLPDSEFLKRPNSTEKGVIWLKLSLTNKIWLFYVTSIYEKLSCSLDWIVRLEQTGSLKKIPESVPGLWVGLSLPAEKKPAF